MRTNKTKANRNDSTIKKSRNLLSLQIHTLATHAFIHEYSSNVIVFNVHVFCACMRLQLLLNVLRCQIVYFGVLFDVPSVGRISSWFRAKKIYSVLCLQFMLCVCSIHLSIPLITKRYKKIDNIVKRPWGLFGGVIIGFNLI